MPFPGDLEGFLNLGGGAGAMSRQSPARVFNTTFVVSLARPAFVSYRVSVQFTTVADRGTLDLLSGPASPPTDLIAGCGYGTGDVGSICVWTLSGLVLPGHNVRLNAITNAGAPTIQLQSLIEWIL